MDEVDAASPPSNATFPLPDLTIRFVKNTQGVELTEQELSWFTALRDHLATNEHERVTITGHTDNDGEEALNKRLSLHRARMVRDRAIALGLAGERIEAIGMGAGEPIADNLTSKGKALNRRVEVHVGERR